MSTIQSWKPSPLHAALFEEPAPATPTTLGRHNWGFGARGASQVWTPPQAKPVPVDYLRKQK